MRDAYFFGLVAVLTNGLMASFARAEAPVPASQRTATHCVKLDFGKEYEGDKKLKRFMLNTCPQPIEVALCLESGGDLTSHCGASDKYYRWRFVIGANERKFNQFQIPEQGGLAYGACYGKWNSIVDLTKTGGYSCKPPPPPPIDVQSELICGEGESPTGFRLKVLFSRKGAKAVEVVTDDKRRQVFSAATIAKWPESSSSESLLVHLPIVKGNKTVLIPLTESTIWGAVCKAPPSGIYTKIKSKLKEALQKHPKPCVPPEGKSYVDHCFKKTKAAGPVRG